MLPQKRDVAREKCRTNYSLALYRANVKFNDKFKSSAHWACSCWLDSTKLNIGLENYPVAPS